ncbi:hypothetical protein JCM19047_2663 [Bacillus sp. JCM 19047]|nr:hypothetical protein JCM19047_2663 [Bacillus sp. JCM 19047]
MVGFGSSSTGVTLGAFTVADVGEFSFRAPRAGTIDSLSVSFTSTVGVTLPIGTGAITATVYKATGAILGSTPFLPTTATVTLTPAVAGLITIGDTFTGTVTGLAEPVLAGDLLLLVLQIASPDITFITVLTGNTSAGLSIT